VLCHWATALGNRAKVVGVWGRGYDGSYGPAATCPVRFHPPVAARTRRWNSPSRMPCHGVVTVTATHQVLPQPALILFHCTISLSHVPLMVPTLTGACRRTLGGTSSGMIVQSHDPGRELDGQSGGERDAICQKMSAILVQNDQLGGADCNGSAPYPCSQHRKPAVMAGLFVAKCRYIT
jgi:hypothetical protein